MSFTPKRFAKSPQRSLSVESVVTFTYSKYPLQERVHTKDSPGGARLISPCLKVGMRIR